MVNTEKWLRNTENGCETLKNDGKLNKTAEKWPRNGERMIFRHIWWKIGGEKWSWNAKNIVKQIQNDWKHVLGIHRCDSGVLVKAMNPATLDYFTNHLTGPMVSKGWRHPLVITHFFWASTKTLLTSSSYVPHAHSLTSGPTGTLFQMFLKFNFVKIYFNERNSHEFQDAHCWTISTRLEVMARSWAMYMADEVINLDPYGWLVLPIFGVKSVCGQDMCPASIALLVTFEV